MLFRNEDPPKKKRAVVLAESIMYPDGTGRDDTFIREAENVKKFYGDKADVQIMPFYGQEEFQSIKKQMGQLSPDDEVYVFGHGGSTLGGVPHDQIAGTLKERGAKNCFMGSCKFERYAEPYKQMQNFMYNPHDSWWGFNPQSKTPIEGMFSRVTDYEKSNEYGSTAKIVQPEQGIHYNRIFNRPKAEAIPNRIMRSFPQLQ